MAAAAGCGYQVLRLQAPFGARAVVVQPFAEASVSGAGEALTAALRAQLAASGVQVVGSSAAATGALTGDVRLWTQPGTTLQAVQVYTLQGVAHASFVDRDGSVRWRGDASAHESFLPQPSLGDSQPLGTETQRRLALGRLVGRLAELLLQDLAAAQLVDKAAPDAGA